MPCCAALVYFAIALSCSLGEPVRGEVAWKEVSGTKIPIPPREHPRLKEAELPDRNDACRVTGRMMVTGAIDSGLYTGSSGRYGSPHCRNYYWRTIAHNCLLVRDGGEDFGASRGYGNDGGQRVANGRNEPKTLEALLDPENGYRTGSVLARGFGPDPQAPAYTHLTSDITAAYSGKVKQVVRSFVFLNLFDKQAPAALVVFDRVVASDPRFEKAWLLHTLEEPEIDGRRVLVDRKEHGERGRLILTSLLPSEPRLKINKIGGPGNEYRVGGENYANDPESGRNDRSSRETGDWRIELVPAEAKETDLLLNVMQVTDRIGGRALPVSPIEAAGLTGCRP